MCTLLYIPQLNGITCVCAARARAGREKSVDNTPADNEILIPPLFGFDFLEKRLMEIKLQATTGETVTINQTHQRIESKRRVYAAHADSLKSCCAHF